MQYWQCEVIGCLEVAAWTRAPQADKSLEEFLCNDCWLNRCVSAPEQAAYYIVCNAKLATPQVCPDIPGIEQKPVRQLKVIM